ncbi:MAG: hypothetical protein IPI01_07850 [Ignavibacteriae bacterium]|nr:hypothetical protein [Ignavibacteriota bacterium]
MTRMIPMLLLGALLTGCASSFQPVTDSLRASTDLSTAVLHVPNTIRFRSLNTLVPIDTTTPFRNDGHLYLVLAKSDTGRIAAQGPTWLLVDFGRGITLRFDRASTGDYQMPGWGTISVHGERFDMQLGMLSGKEIPLLVEPLHP